MLLRRELGGNQSSLLTCSTAISDVTTYKSLATLEMFSFYLFTDYCLIGKVLKYDQYR